MNNYSKPACDYSGSSCWSSLPQSSPRKALRGLTIRLISVGGEICAACHAAETARWKEFHHAQAMQAATPVTVLGDFADAKLDHFGVVTTFSPASDKFMVRTDGPDGALHD